MQLDLIRPSTAHALVALQQREGVKPGTLLPFAWLFDELIGPPKPPPSDPEKNREDPRLLPTIAREIKELRHELRRTGLTLEPVAGLGYCIVSASRRSQTGGDDANATTSRA
jgi:hypothetical protein